MGTGPLEHLRVERREFLDEPLVRAGLHQQVAGQRLIGPIAEHGAAEAWDEVLGRCPVEYELFDCPTDAQRLESIQPSPNLHHRRGLGGGSDEVGCPPTYLGRSRRAGHRVQKTVSRVESGSGPYDDRCECVSGGALSARDRAAVRDVGGTGFASGVPHRLRPAKQGARKLRVPGDAL